MSGPPTGASSDMPSAESSPKQERGRAGGPSGHGWTLVPVPPIGIITAGRMAATQGISGPAGIELGVAGT